MLVHARSPLKSGNVLQGPAKSRDVHFIMTYRKKDNTQLDYHEATL